MKKIRLISLGLAVMLVFGFGGIAFAGGGWEDPAQPCPLPEDIPEPDAGKFVHGDFSIARELQGCLLPPQTGLYNIQLMLKRAGTKKLYHFSVSIGDGDLCALEPEDIMMHPDLVAVPCELGIAEDFGLEGIPVFQEIEITLRDNCDDPDKVMIQGKVWIRVVPVEPVE